MPKRFRVRISGAAERDVDEIWRFIRQDSLENATTFLNQLERQVSTLETFPARCPLIPENQLLGTQYRHLIFGDYRTVFRIAGGSVYVLRIIHSARLLDAPYIDYE
jgi:plasmid stabilization system protein ParE